MLEGLWLLAVKIQLDTVRPELGFVNIPSLPSSPL